MPREKNNKHVFAKHFSPVSGYTTSSLMLHSSQRHLLAINRTFRLKKLVCAMAPVMMYLFAGGAHAADIRLPKGGQVVSGSATISQQSTSLRVEQQTSKASLTWDSFDIGRSASVAFDQPNAQSVAVNRITGANGSEIMGRLSANGQVFIINPNGVLFGRNAQVNVGGIVATTLDLDDSSLNSGSLRFSGVSTGSVVNNGVIQSAAGGYVAMLGQEVRNNGIISAKLGSVALGAGSEARLTFSGNQLLSLQVDQGAVDALADNEGLIKADGGQVYMTASAANQLTTAVVNNSGVIEAQTLVEREGKIILLGDMSVGETTVSGTLDASAPNGGDGGFIETSAAQVSIDSGADITTYAPLGLTGNWLLDPFNYTIAAAGGDMTGAQISVALENNNVTIMSDDGMNGIDGDIFVDDAITWSAATSFELTAYRNIYINQAITSTSSGESNIVLRADNTEIGIGTVSFSGAGNVVMAGTGSADIFYNPLSGDYTNEVNYSPFISGSHYAWMLVHDVNDLQNMDTNLSGSYALAKDIDATATIGWNGGEGFNPIGDNVTVFDGNFNGQNFTISNLTINRPTESYVALFGYGQTDSVIYDVDLVGGSVTGGERYIGALVGFNSSNITNVRTDVAVVGQNRVGGLVGINYSDIAGSSATGTVTGSGASVGGLIGSNNGDTVSRSYAGGKVVGADDVGGLIGYLAGGDISQSYSDGEVEATTSKAGGLIGHAINGSISETYAIGKVEPGTDANGLVGWAESTVTFAHNFFDDSPTLGTGQPIGVGASGPVTGVRDMPSAAFFDSENFTSATAANGNVNPNWDLASAWRMYDDETRPLIRSLLTDVTVTANDVTREYDGAVYAGAHSAVIDPNVTLLGSIAFSAPGVNATTYDITPSGYYSVGQDGYNIIFENGTQTITPKPLSITGSMAANRIFNGNTTATVTAGSIDPSGFIGGETVVVQFVSGVFDNKNVGVGKTVTASYTLANGVGGGVAGNYSLADDMLSADITPSSLIVTTTDISRVYDGGTVGAGTAVLTDRSNPLYGTDVLSGGTFRFTTKHVGVGDKIVGISDVTVADGNSGNNYVISYVNNVTSTITPRAIQFGTGDISKVYDASTTATSTAIELVGAMQETDSFSGGSFTFDDVNVGTGKTVSVADVVIDDGNGGANYSVTYGANANSTITRASVSFTTSDVVRDYDGTTAAEGTTILHTGSTLFGTDSFSGGSYIYNDRHAGTNKTVSVSGVTIADGNGGNNYSISYVDNTTSTISPEDLALGTSDISRVYNNSTAASSVAEVLTGTLYTGVGDSISGGTFTFDTEHVGANKTVSVTGVTINDGNSGNNYAVSYVDNVNSSITQAPLELSSSNVSRVYDSTNVAVGNAEVVGGTLYSGDTLSGGIFTFDTANVGTNKTISASEVTVNDGNGGNNYEITYSDNLLGQITAAALEITSTDVVRVYDGTTAAAGNAVLTAASDALQGSDSISGGLFLFDNRHVGNAKSVSVAGVTINDGNGGNNYTVTYRDNTSSTVTAADVAFSSADIVKGYDNTTTGVSTAQLVSGTIFGGDSFSGGTFVFDSEHAATMKTVVVDNVVIADGNGGNNYNVNYINNTNSVITPALLELGTNDIIKSYDNTTSANSVAQVLSGTLYAGDNLSGGRFNFDTEHVGINKRVTTADVVINDGNGGNNYTVTYTDNTASSITQASLQLASSNVTKVYDGGTDADGTATVTSGTLFDGDSLSGGSFRFDTRHAGSGKSISTSGVTVNDGNGGNNYRVTYVDNTTGVITPAQIDVTAVAITRGYDGTVNASSTAQLTSGSGPLYGSDSLSGGDFAFDNRNAGLAKSLSVNNVSVNDGNSGNNYSVNYIANRQSSITPATLVVTSSSVIKTYDANTSASANPAIASGRLYAGDGFNTDGIFAFADQNVGINKTVTVAGVTVNDGNGGNNYALTYQDNTSSRINPAMLTITATDGSKVYDGASYAGGEGITYAGFVGGETEAIVTGELSYSGTAQGAKNAGVYSLVAQGLDAPNYTVAYSPGVYTIDQAQLYYVADYTVAYAGQPTNLSGSIDGLIGADTVDEVTTGTAVWTSLAPPMAEPGIYGIEGSGLTVVSTNYVDTLLQASTNSSAMLLSPSPESPEDKAIDDAKQAIRDDEIESIAYSSVLGVNDDTKIIFDIAVRNEGIRLPEGLSRLPN